MGKQLVENTNSAASGRSGATRLGRSYGGTRADEVALADVAFDRCSGRTRWTFNIDDWSYDINSIFHNVPDLAPETWNACLHDISLACLVDLSTATLSRRMVVDQ